MSSIRFFSTIVAQIYGVIILKIYNYNIDYSGILHCFNTIYVQIHERLKRH